MNIEELIKDLDKKLTVLKSKRTEKKIEITCEMNLNKSECPYCGEVSDSVHSKYIRTLSDLPIQNNEVKLLLVVKKFFCQNPKCTHKTFGERYKFVEPKAVRTNRLVEYINNIGLRDNSMDTVRTLRETGIKVSSNTVLRIIKKKKRNI